MNHIDKKQISDIEKRFDIFEKFINNSKMLKNEEKTELLYSLRYIIYIILKYKNSTKGNL